MTLGNFLGLILLLIVGAVCLRVLTRRRIKVGPKRNATYTAEPIQTEEHEVTLDRSFPYSKRACILTHTEQTFFRKLQAVYGDYYYIFPQINLDKLVNINSWKHGYRNSIDRKSVDFVIVNKETLETVMVLELDDPTHLRPDRMQRDEFVNDFFQQVGITFAHLDREFFEKEFPLLLAEQQAEKHQEAEEAGSFPGN